MKPLLHRPTSPVKRDENEDEGKPRRGQTSSPAEFLLYKKRK